MLKDGQGFIKETELNKIITDEINNKAEKTYVDTQTADLVKVKKNLSVLSVNWVDDTSTSGYWYHDILDADITADTVVDINIHLSDLANASDIKSANESFAGYVRLYSETQLLNDITVDLKLIKAVV